MLLHMSASRHEPILPRYYVLPSVEEATAAALAVPLRWLDAVCLYFCTSALVCGVQFFSSFLLFFFSPYPCMIDHFIIYLLSAHHNYINISYTMSLCGPNVYVLACLLSRLLLTYVASQSNGTTLKILGLLTCGAVSGWLLILSGVWKRDWGIKTCRQPIWWGAYKPLHVVFYSAFAYYALKGERQRATHCLILNHAACCCGIHTPPVRHEQLKPAKTKQAYLLVNGVRSIHPRYCGVHTRGRVCKGHRDGFAHSEQEHSWYFLASYFQPAFATGWIHP